jgi:hypothetical protein
MDAGAFGVGIALLIGEEDLGSDQAKHLKK